MTLSDDDQQFLCLEASAEEMDRFWAEGWRHFGIFFFRYRTAVHGKKTFTVLPLRLDVSRFALTRSLKRVVGINRDLTSLIQPASVDKVKKALFSKHRLRFKENVPTSLSNFLSPLPATVPCRNLELCVYLGKKLTAVTFLDLGQTATSAVYAMFDPGEAKRSLGILMMLHSIQFTREQGYRYYYPGYAYREPFAYDYKKRFLGLEYLDWQTGWKPYVRN
ncbi:MAG TPA: arginine-tRNA-protein transferase [Candidatus Binatia bacterium]|jgi:leucyl-tRNA---protein transferase|nr:arginine-tRNA-protein transferase [Candidatus Binatia bacterium]